MTALIALGNAIRTNHHWKRAIAGLYSLAAFAVIVDPNILHWK